MAFLLCVAIQMVFPFVHFVAVFASMQGMLYHTMLRIRMSPKVFRVSERSRAVVTLVLMCLCWVVLALMMPVYVSVASWNLSKIGYVFTSGRIWS